MSCDGEKNAFRSPQVCGIFNQNGSDEDEALLLEGTEGAPGETFTDERRISRNSSSKQVILLKESWFIPDCDI
jgi:hypothetical protein